MTDDTISTAELAQMLHDLKGPVATAMGFQGELEKALQESRKIINRLDADNNPEAAALESVIEEDFTPCTEHLGAVLATLKYRISLLSDRSRKSGEPDAE